MFWTPPCAAADREPPIRLRADLTDAPRRLLHAEMDIPARPGVLDVTAAEWIPGLHGPDGPVHDIVGLVFTAGGRTLRWRRDPVDTYRFHVDVPAGVRDVHARLDCIAARANRASAFLEWEALMLYPAGRPVRDIVVEPSVTLPAGWTSATALRPVIATPGRAGATTRYLPVSIETLEDSPVLAGADLREFALGDAAGAPHVLDVAGPTARSIGSDDARVEALRRLVHEATALLGPPHYGSYRFLVRLDGEHGGGGLEHHESSATTLPRDFFGGARLSVGLAGLLPHEFVHSWNGKYRRPAGLATDDFATPMRTDLLWIYEGLTNYLGDLLGERAGLVGPGQYRDYLAETAATMDAQSGRAWRSIADTTFETAMPSNGGGQGPEWSGWRRGTDYYPEGTLLWLDVDTTIRRLTGDRRSLLDFLRLFLGKGGRTGPAVAPYALDEVERDLSSVAPGDWRRFFEERVYEVRPRADVDGIDGAGYRLVFTPEDAAEGGGTPQRTVLVIWLSVGLKVGEDGAIADVRRGSAADAAGLAPDGRIVACDGRAFGVGGLADAIRAAARAGPIELTVRDGDEVKAYRLDYHGGLRFPRLVRRDGTPDRLSAILAPLSARPGSAQ